MQSQLFLLLNRRRFRDSLSLSQRRRRSGVLRRNALSNPDESPFVELYNSGLDDALVIMTGFDHRVFDELVELALPYYDSYSPYNREGDGIRRLPEWEINVGGHKRSLTCHGCVGLALVYLRTRGSRSALQMLFGLTPGPLSNWLRFTMRILITVLGTVEEAQVKLPTHNELVDFVTVITDKYPLLLCVWAAMDGLKIPIQASPDFVTQSRFYNGWTHGHYMSCLFLFARWEDPMFLHQRSGMLA